MRQESPGRLGASDCERLREGRVAQPVNTATSAAYVVAGAVVAARQGGPGAPRAGAARAFGATLAMVGVGSIAFHGPQPRGARWLHDLPIAAILGLMALTPAVRLATSADPVPGWAPRRGLAAAGLGAVAVASYAAGRTGAPTCDPDSRWQWHGAWHVLSAAAFAVAGDVLHGTTGGRG